LLISNTREIDTDDRVQKEALPKLGKIVGIYQAGVVPNRDNTVLHL
jgi:hypothetical protein